MMQPYTLEQRLCIYQIVKDLMLTDANSGNYYCSGFCWVIEKALMGYFDDENLEDHPLFDGDDDEESSYFPEISKHKPAIQVYSDGEPGGRYWFNTHFDDGAISRIAILIQAIDEIKAKLKEVGN